MNELNGSAWSTASEVFINRGGYRLLVVTHPDGAEHWYERRGDEWVEVAFKPSHMADMPKPTSISMTLDGE